MEEKIQDKTFSEVVLEYFPDATEDEVDYILWNETGFPCFWETDDTEACLRKQLAEFMLEANTYSHLIKGGE